MTGLPPEGAFLLRVGAKITPATRQYARRWLRAYALQGFTVGLIIGFSLGLLLK